MRVLVDTNIILDVLCNRKEFVDNSLMIFKMCETKQIDGYISALSISNIVYILRKELTQEKTKEIINQLSVIFTIVDLKGDDVKKAVNLDFVDYEDALQSVCATRIHAQFIVSRNIKDFISSRVLAIKPEELLERL